MITNTYSMIDAVKKMYPVVRFIKNRYFPDGKSYFSEKALIETKKQGRKVAPFVIPQVNGITLESEGYRAYEVEAPYIAPKMPITAQDLAQKAFGEDPNSNRSPADRENEVEAEHLDDLRNSVMRRQELMCAEILTKGETVMKHFSSADDAAKDQNYKRTVLRFYDGEFKNKYQFTADFNTMTAAQRITEFYKMASILRKRGVHATDLVMTSDVSMLLMTDKDFLEFYNKRMVETGSINQKEIPEGVTYNGDININGVVCSMFTYDEAYEDLDGQSKPIFPVGTLMFLHPGMGRTAYAQVSFLKGEHFESYADAIVPRIYADEKNNVLEVQAFSRPVPYPLDWDGWLTANINDPVVSQAVADNSVDTDEPQTPGAVLKTEEEIRALKTKASVISYATSIGCSGLTTDDKLEDLQDAVIAYQTKIYGD